MFLSDALEQRGQVDAVYTDFCKAFDKVNHLILKQKLTELGFFESIVSWLCSFVEGRTQKIKIGNFMSLQIKVPSGVPQGSHWGPILFTLFINDIVEHIKFSNCLLFADDLKIFKIITNRDDHQLIQRDLNGIDEWCTSNYLFLNIKKCSSISFVRNKQPLHTQYYIGNERICSVNEIKDLGVTFDSHLIFRKHITVICGKARKAWGCLYRSAKDLNINTLKFYIPP